MGINYSTHGRDEKLLFFYFDALMKVAIRADIRRTQEILLKRSRNKHVKLRNHTLLHWL